MSLGKTRRYGLGFKRTAEEILLYISSCIILPVIIVVYAPIVIIALIYFVCWLCWEKLKKWSGVNYGR